MKNSSVRLLRIIWREKFQRKTAADYLAWQADLVREYKREDQFITHNLDFEWKKFGADIAQDGYSYGVQPDICHYEAAKCLTRLGADIYHPSQDELTGARRSRSAGIPSGA